MKFSIILATLNRSEIVKKSIMSILNQTYKNYEIIIIDQSTNDDTKVNISKLINNKKNNISYYKVDFTGLSKARNFGIKKSTGNYICLMDDDAEYRVDFLDKAFKILKKYKYDIISGLIIEKETKRTFCPIMENKEKEIINYKNINLCSSASLVINKSTIINKVGMFDEMLGAGAYFGAGEEIDLLIRSLNLNYKIYYDKELVVYHPYPVNNFDKKDCMRAYSYGLGEGALCKKTIKASSIKNKKIFIFKFSINIIRTMCAIIVFFRQPNKKNFYIARIKGLVQGYQTYK